MSETHADVSERRAQQIAERVARRSGLYLNDSTASELEIMIRNVVALSEAAGQRNAVETLEPWLNRLEAHKLVCLLGPHVGRCTCGLDDALNELRGER